MNQSVKALATGHVRPALFCLGPGDGSLAKASALPGGLLVILALAGIVTGPLELADGRVYGFVFPNFDAWHEVWTT